MTTIKVIIRQAVLGWKKHGLGLPCEIVLRNLAPVAAPKRDGRWCLFLTYSSVVYVEIAPNHGYQSLSGDTYLQEYDTPEEANRAAGQYRRFINRVWDNN